MSSSNILLSIDRHVATITLDRGARHNALTMAMLADVDLALAKIENARDVRVAVFRSTSPRFFCSGADIEEWGISTPKEWGAVSSGPGTASSGVLRSSTSRLSRCFPAVRLAVDWSSRCRVTLDTRPPVRCSDFQKRPSVRFQAGWDASDFPTWSAPAVRESSYCSVSRLRPREPLCGGWSLRHCRESSLMRVWPKSALCFNVGPVRLFPSASGYCALSNQGRPSLRMNSPRLYVKPRPTPWKV